MSSILKNSNAKKPKKAIPNGKLMVETETSTYQFDERDANGIRRFSTDSCSLIPRNHCKIITLEIGKPMILEYYPPVKDPGKMYRKTTDVVSIKEP